MGLHDGCLTHLRAGAICADEGVAAIALHARTVEQHYAGDARWDAIGELKAHVTTIPVLGNGDIWEAADAVRMMRGDRVRRRRRRPRLPRPAVAVRRPASTCSPAARRRRRARSASPSTVMVDHARLLVDHHADDGGEPLAMRDVPQARLVVPHRLPGRQRGAPPGRPGLVARRARGHRRRARPDDRRSSRAASGSAAATPTGRSRSSLPDGLPRRSRRARARPHRARRRRRDGPLRRLMRRERDVPSHSCFLRKESGRRTVVEDSSKTVRVACSGRATTVTVRRRTKPAAGEQRVPIV